jgi:peptidyl-prolyl cis-trans isomerase C
MRNADVSMRWALGLVFLTVAGCGASSGPPRVPGATIGGVEIPEPLLEYYIAQKTSASASEVPAERRTELLEELKALVAAAQSYGPDPSPETAHAIELSRLEILARAAAVEAGVYAPPTDTQLHAAFDQYAASLPAQEYHVAHILVPTEGAAQDLIARLQTGETFAKLAMSESQDGSRNKEGDLGWIAPGKLPAAFTDAVRVLKPGEFHAKPVHTAYGWHIIKLIESRSAAPPPFEQVQAQLALNLQQERYRAFLAESLDRSGQ